jgi:hypothetical protein
MVVIEIVLTSRAKPQLSSTLQHRMTSKHKVSTHFIPQSGTQKWQKSGQNEQAASEGCNCGARSRSAEQHVFAEERVVAPWSTGVQGRSPTSGQLAGFPPRSSRKGLGGRWDEEWWNANRKRQNTSPKNNDQITTKNEATSGSHIVWGWSSESALLATRFTDFVGSLVGCI